MPLEGPAIAEGDLGRTPFAHLLVVAADSHLSGAVFLTEPSGVEHVIRFARGVPVKVRAGDRYAMFGEILIEDGLLSQETLEEALATKGLLGDVLMLSGHLDAATLDWVAETQFVRRIVHLFELPAATRYRCAEGHRALEEWGGEPAQVDLLALLWAGLRAHADRSTLLGATLDQLRDMPLRLHPGIEAGRFGFREAEVAILERLRQGAPSLATLLRSGLAAEAAIRRLVYALVVTRYIDLGIGCWPLGLDEASSLSSTQKIARMRLRSVAHRIGAAAPDPAGDGERIPASIRGRREI
jgi:hypothetical protein